MIPFVSGYFVTDLIFMLLNNRVNGYNVEHLLHHVAALVLIGSGITERVSRFVPHFMVCELSTIPLNIMWFMRQYGVATPDNKYFAVTALAFLSTFTLTRIVNMPIFLHAAFTTHRSDIDRMGLAKWTLPAVQALQIWWYYKILKQFSPLINLGLYLLRAKLANRRRIGM